MRVTKTLHVGWSKAEEYLPGQGTVLITDGDSLGDFFGRTVGVDEEDVPKLIKALETLIENRQKATV